MDEDSIKNPVIDKSDIVFKPVHKTKNVSLRQTKKIDGIMKKGMRHFGSPGATLTYMKDPDRKDALPEGWKPEVLDIALKGEQDTTKFILNWMKDKPGVVLIDSMHIPGAGKETVDEETGLIEGGDTDHILVIGNNVIVIDSKAWKKKARYTVEDNHTVLRNGKQFPGGNVKINDAIYMWFDYIDCDDCTLFGAIFIDNGDEPDPKTKEWSTSVFRDNKWWKNLWFLVEKSRMGSWLDERYRKIAGYDANTGEYTNLEAVKTIDPNIIAQIVHTCTEPYSWAKAKGIDLSALL